MMRRTILANLTATPCFLMHYIAGHEGPATKLLITAEAAMKQMYDELPSSTDRADECLKTCSEKTHQAIAGICNMEH